MRPDSHEVTVDSDVMTAYLQANTVSSTPLIYRRMALMSLIGGTLGRKVYVRDGDRKVYPNMYVMLVGDSGSKKSTAITDAVEFMGMVGYRNFPNVRTSSDKFLDDFADRIYQLEASVQEQLDTPISETKLVLAIDEAKDFFCSGGSDIQASMVRLYDCPDEYKTSSRANGDKTINQPSLGYIGGATPQTLSEIIPPSSHQNGLLSRTLLVMETIRPAYVPQPVADKRLLERAARNLARHMALAGEVYVDAEAMKLLNELGLKRVGPSDARLRSYIERRRDHLLKLAMITAICMGSKFITSSIMSYANSILTYCECTMHFALGGYGLNKNGAQATEILCTLLYSNGVLYFDDLPARLGLTVDKLPDLSLIISHLVHIGLIMAVTPPNGKSYYTLAKRAPFFTDYKAYTNPKLLLEFNVTENIIAGGVTPREIHKRTNEARYGSEYRPEAILETQANGGTSSAATRVIAEPPAGASVARPATPSGAAVTGSRATQSEPSTGSNGYSGPNLSALARRVQANGWGRESDE